MERKREKNCSFSFFAFFSNGVYPIISGKMESPQLRQTDREKEKEEEEREVEEFRDAAAVAREARRIQKQSTKHLKVSLKNLMDDTWRKRVSRALR